MTCPRRRRRGPRSEPSYVDLAQRRCECPVPPSQRRREVVYDEGAHDPVVQRVYVRHVYGRHQPVNEHHDESASQTQGGQQAHVHVQDHVQGQAHVHLQDHIPLQDEPKVHRESLLHGTLQLHTVSLAATLPCDPAGLWEDHHEAQALRLVARRYHRVVKQRHQVASYMHRGR